MDKRQYKISRLYPVPQTGPILGLCCSPIGRSTILYEVGTQAPIPKAKDYGYIVFRKRDCCSGAVGNK
jgi:conjugal transfer pilus assembly protein TraU